MGSGQIVAARTVASGRLVLGPGVLLLGIDTCGPTGSVALGRVAAGELGALAKSGLEILGEIELEGRNYSSTLIVAVADLLKGAGVGLKDVGAIVAVHGPGSFTGVRVGLSAVKGLAEPSRIPVAVLSRLEVLAVKAGVEAAALDAHRGEVFLRIGGRGAGSRTGEPEATGTSVVRPSSACRASAGQKEILAGAVELNSIEAAPKRMAVCDDAAAALLASAWPACEMVRVAAPMAGDALRVAAERMGNGAKADLALGDIAIADLALLDGNYLRRSDAEIFGEATGAKRA